MIKNILTIIAFFVSTIAVAQYNPEAKKYLDEVAAAVKTEQGLTISFDAKVTHIQDNEELSTTSGVMLLKDNFYKLSIGGTDTYSDGVNQWIHMLEEKEVTIQPIEEGEITPASIFTIYKEGYRFRILKEDSENVMIELSPDDRDASEYIRVTLYINKKESKIDAFAAQSKSGHITNIVVTSWQDEIADKDAIVFNLNKHTDVDVIDLR